MIKIYTRTGDQGTTALFGGKRVSKDDQRVEAYGTVDELNAIIGLARVHSSLEIVSDMDVLLQTIQQELFTLGADLATPAEEETTRGRVKIQRINSQQVHALEREIDHYESELAPLTRFILPGGSALAAALHHARVVCRRAERRTVTLFQLIADNLPETQNSTASSTPEDLAEPINMDAIRYLNRLSDLLFVLARVANHRLKISDVIWNS